MIKRDLQIMFFIIGLFSILAGYSYAVEPAMSDYTSYPIFMSQSVKPNILIILDNSGSMNFAAYGTWPGDGGTITDAPYTGSTPYCGEVNIRVVQSRDDAEQDTDNNSSWYDSGDLDFGGISGSCGTGGTNDSIVGVRFQNVDIPSGVTITRAYIEFTSVCNQSVATTLTITGQLNDDTTQFDGSNSDLSDRPETGTTVTWTISGASAWSSGVTYQTPDLKGIVQEIVSREGWNAGNSMVFFFEGTGKRDVYSYDGDPNKAPFLHVEFTPTNCTRYYGYFDPDAHYSYSSNRFVRDPNGPWYGNWLNWLSMRRVDVARKVLVGGKATSRTGGGNTTLYGENPAQSSRGWYREFNPDPSSGVSLTPYDDVTNYDYRYLMQYGYIYVYRKPKSSSSWSWSHIASYKIAVEKDETEEPEEFVDGNIAGVLQKVGDRARWGLEFYNFDRGGKIYVSVHGGNLTNMVTEIQNKGCDTWTPLAESFYEGCRYFQQISPPAYDRGDYTTNNQHDPYYWEDMHDFIPCGKSFVILITDGESTEDLEIPDELKDYDSDGNDPGSYSYNGSNYLDDVALWAHVNDLRSDLESTQNITFYTVFAFGVGSQLLQDAAKNGGFIDKNGNNRPDLQEEWDADGDGMPDTYFEAPDGYQLEAKLITAITDILKRAASGTAVSVLATSGEGEGNLVQAYFKPSVTSGVTEVKWVGYLQSLWVDQHGYLREDTDGDLALDITVDKVVDYFFDESSGDAKIKRYAVSATTPYPDLDSDPYEEVSLDGISPLWEAGSRLAQRDPDDRKIFTYIDKDKDEVVDEPSGDYDTFDGDGELISFDTTNMSKIKSYLGVEDYSSWKYLGATHDARAGNLIKYIRGEESGFSGTTTMDIRTREINGNIWKLGDIVHSTPVSVSRPPDNYHLIYGDESYHNYYNQYKNRETMVYVGANDGMLHAFTSWIYSAVTKAYTKPATAPSDEQIGDELWAYIPQCLLPHLKWLPSSDYTHVYYVDLKPKVFDAKILPDDTHYTDSDSDDNWGTFLLGGLRFGGKHIWSEGDYDDGSGTTVSETRHFYSSYFLLDITEPRSPRLMWERTYQDLGLTTSFPAIIKVQNKWFAVFGSGPEDYDGTSSKKGHVFVIDLNTGDAYPNLSNFSSGITNAWLFEGNENNAFMNSPVALDKNVNYNVDAVYIGETYQQGGNWKGKLYKVSIPWDWSGVTTYVDDPNDSTSPWTFNEIFDATRPITAPVSLSIDSYDNVWVYFGTGRYLSEDDKTNTDTQYLFGICDPFFNSYYDEDHGDYYHNYSKTKVLGLSNLFDADPYTITTTGQVFRGSSLFGDGTWSHLLSEASSYDGWKRTLDTSGERAVNKFSVLGGIVFAPTFIPNDDICGFGGNSNLYGLYYETGTAYYESSFVNHDVVTVTIGGNQYQEISGKMDLGAGKASALGIHVGRESGAKAYVQQSTGAVIDVSLSPAFNVKSGLISWKDKWD